MDKVNDIHGKLEEIFNFQKALEFSKVQDPEKAAQDAANALLQEVDKEEQKKEQEKAKAEAKKKKIKKLEKDMVRLTKNEKIRNEEEKKAKEENRRDRQSMADKAADQIKKEEEESKNQEQQQLMMEAVELDKKERLLEKERLLADKAKESKEQEVNEEKKKEKELAENGWERLAETDEITSKEKYVSSVLSVLDFNDDVYERQKRDGGPFDVFENEKPLLLDILKSLTTTYPDLLFVIVGGGAVQYYKEKHKTSDLDIKIFKKSGGGDKKWVSDMRDRIYSFLEMYEGGKLGERFVYTRGMVFPKNCDLLWNEAVNMFPARIDPHQVHHPHHPDLIKRITYLSTTPFGDGKIPIKLSIKKEHGPLKMVYSLNAQNPIQVMAPLMEFTFSILDPPQFRNFGSETAPINVMTREELLLNLHQNFTKEPGLLKRIRAGDGTESIYPEKIFSWLRQVRSLKDTSKEGGTRKKYRKKYKTRRIKKRKRIKKSLFKKKIRSLLRTKKKHHRKKRKSRKKIREKKKSRKKSRKIEVLFL